MAQTLEEARKYREENIQALFERLKRYEETQEWEKVIEYGELILSKISMENRDTKAIVEEKIELAKNVKGVAL